MIKIKSINCGELRRNMKQVSISEAETLGLKQIGSGGGFDVEYCIYMGIKYCKDFIKRAKYYTIISSVQNIGEDAKDMPNEGSFVSVKFYNDVENEK